MAPLLVVHVDRGWAWGSVIAGFIANLITGGLAKSFGIVMKEFRDVFECPAAYMTLAGGLIYTFMYSTSIVVHLVSTRIGARIVVAVGAFGATFCVLGAALAESVALWVTVIGVGLGISLSCIYFSAFVVVGQCFDRQLGLANGLSVAGVSVGQIVFPSIVSLVIDEYTIRGGTLIAAGIVFHLLIASVLMPSKIIRESPEEKSTISTHDTELGDGLTGDRKEEEEDKKEAKAPSMDWVLFAIFTIAKIFSDVGDVGLSIIFPPMGREIGLDNYQIGLAIACGGGVDLVSRLVIGYLSDFKGCKRSLILLAAWVIEAANGIAMAHCTSLSGFITCYIVFGVCSGTAMALMIVVLTDFVGVFHLPRSFAIMMVGIGVNLTPAQFMLGYVKDQVNTYRWSIVIGSVSVFVGALVLLLEHPVRFVRRRRLKNEFCLKDGQQELTPIAGDDESKDVSKQPEFHTSRSSLHIIANASVADDVIG